MDSDPMEMTNFTGLLMIKFFSARQKVRDKIDDTRVYEYSSEFYTNGKKSIGKN